MNIKSALITAAVQLLAANTNVIRQDSPAEQFFNSLFGLETEQQRVTRQTEAAVDKALATASRVRTNVKFKKIVKNV